VQRWTQTGDSGTIGRVARNILSLLLTGIVVEVALAPIALFHFHQSGLYGALANMIAIPLTTFVIMPAEALALLFDGLGLGAPFWWVTGQALAFLLWMAHSVAAVPGAVARLPEIPLGAFALIIVGGVWLLLWRTRMRLLGLIPAGCGMFFAAITPAPDLLITGDGKHVAVRGDGGAVAILRPRAGDYVRDLLAERSAFGDELSDLDTLSGAKCSDDVCVVTLMRGGRSWTIAATRSRHFLEWRDMMRVCDASDILISDRNAPKACMPRWIKADRQFLAETGGLAVFLGEERVQSVRRLRDDHPWVARAASDGAK
jgi:competence protein ComEC